MIDYRAGVWGFHVALGWHGSLAPRALTMAVPSAILTWICAYLFDASGDPLLLSEKTENAAQMVIASFTPVMLFILYNRSNTAYDRWWEGGTLLQKTRGEWFNAYSSIMAFTSTKPEMQDQVESYVHLLARLMSLLMCCGLQQVSPNRDRPFEIIDLEGIEPASMEFLNSAPDKVEIILQWIQRSMVLHSQTGVLPVPPPILSRAFQEVSRGIVNLQNARKIADFPYPYPLAQVSMILQLVYYALVPILAALAMPVWGAVTYSFSSIFVLWCIHFNALDLEFPFGSRVNDLPMNEMQQEWNKSVCTLLSERASRPPAFHYQPVLHGELIIAMSDASDLYIPTTPVLNKGVSTIKIDHRGSFHGHESGKKGCSTGGGKGYARSQDSPTKETNEMKITPKPAPVTPAAATPASAATSAPPAAQLVSEPGPKPAEPAAAPSQTTAAAAPNAAPPAAAKANTPELAVNVQVTMLNGGGSEGQLLSSGRQCLTVVENSGVAGLNNDANVDGLRQSGGLGADAALDRTPEERNADARRHCSPATTAGGSDSGGMGIGRPPAGGAGSRGRAML
eukprot:TRINITY_DN31635_c0_g2_i1.p1 TRINITY_DN31635_c0_g2~~TRINITY_DN31635_c0_g2_i1.p1  ORF type:complete len:566 (+),score=108.04 TRINITY_DN31635_c0_g2_i1:129-1826(+)